jgi:hypothetical protein
MADLAEPHALNVREPQGRCSGTFSIRLSATDNSWSTLPAIGQDARTPQSSSVRRPVRDAAPWFPLLRIRAGDGCEAAPEGDNYVSHSQFQPLAPARTCTRSIDTMLEESERAIIKPEVG